jgi:hypothetical protein
VAEDAILVALHAAVTETCVSSAKHVNSCKENLTTWLQICTHCGEEEILLPFQQIKPGFLSHSTHSPFLHQLVTTAIVMYYFQHQ